MFAHAIVSGSLSLFLQTTISLISTLSFLSCGRSINFKKATQEKKCSVVSIWFASAATHILMPTNYQHAVQA
jgi:hypothetical protein